MFTVFGFLTLVFYLVNAAPLLTNNHDHKLLNEQSSYQTFNLYELPIVAKRPPLKGAPTMTNHQVRADLSVVSSAEANPSDPDPFTGYGEASETASTDMFVINPPANAQEPDSKPIGVAPKLNGRILAPPQGPPTDKNGAAVINPTAYFLEGADLDKIQKPKCRMLGCGGPIVDDDIMIEADESDAKEGEVCRQAFVPIVDAQVRVGYSCRICCESTDLLKELKKTRLQLESN